MENKGNVMEAKMKVFILSLAILSLSSMSACAGPQTPGSILRPWNESDYPAKYSAKEIRARVVDADTGEPVEGVVVVAKWVLTGGMSPPLNLEVLEAVTDKDGWFYIPGWGPKRRPVLRFLEHRDPVLLIFKTGYAYDGLENMNKEKVTEYVKAVYGNLNIDELDADKLLKVTQHMSPLEQMSNGPVRECIWNGRTIKLRKPADEEKYWSLVERFQSAIGWDGFGWPDYKTDWEAIKAAVKEIEKARKSKPERYYLSTLPDNVWKTLFGEEKP